MIEIRLAESAGNVDRAALTHDIFAPQFLLKRPLLEALAPDDGIAPVLLIDELDRTDEPFEAYLLEVLAEYQVTIPELGPVRAATPPVVVVTSNRTREIHDAIKRRCLYHWVGYPDAATELAIVRRKCPRAAESLARSIVAFTQRLRTMDLFKAPGIAETLDWAEALVALDRIALDPQTVADTAGVLLKYQDDVGALTPAVAARLVDEAQVEGHPRCDAAARPGIETRAARGRRPARAEGAPRRERRPFRARAARGRAAGRTRADARGARGGRRRRPREPRGLSRGARRRARVAPRAAAGVRAGVRSVLAQSEAARKADRVAPADRVRPRRRARARTGAAGADRAGDVAARRPSTCRAPTTTRSCSTPRSRCRRARYCSARTSRR